FVRAEPALLAQLGVRVRVHAERRRQRHVHGHRPYRRQRHAGRAGALWRLREERLGRRLAGLDRARLRAADQRLGHELLAPVRAALPGQRVPDRHAASAAQHLDAAEVLRQHRVRQRTVGRQLRRAAVTALHFPGAGPPLGEGRRRHVPAVSRVGPKPEITFRRRWEWAWARTGWARTGTGTRLPPAPGAAGPSRNRPRGPAPGAATGTARYSRCSPRSARPRTAWTGCCTCT